MQINNRNCPICGSVKNKKLYSKNFHDTALYLGHKYNVVVCSSCGFTYASSIPSQYVYDEYYATMSKYEFKDIDNYASDFFIKHAERIYKFVEPFLWNDEISILDIGCSTGSLLRKLKDEGYKNLCGIDPSPNCAATVRDIHQIKANQGTITNFSHNEHYNVIFLSAVLEHVVDLNNAMEAVSYLQNENDLLFIDVPNVKLFDKYVYVPFQQFNSEHINYFSFFSLKNLLHQYSYEIIEARGYKVKRTKDIIEPDMFILAKKIDRTKPIQKDFLGEDCVLKYIKKCQKKEKAIKKRFYKKIKNINDFVVWGTGEHSKWLFDEEFDFSKIICFVDSDNRFWNKRFRNKLILGPHYAITGKTPIFISSWAHQNEIKRHIRNNLKLSNKIITLY
jgi:2-polyprenyl-3-methyl-5-hydroxy-6-metoxy-1,4-benzoquinol methylase